MCEKFVAMGGGELMRQTGAGTYVLASWLFLRFLGSIYLVAFVSLGTQVRGLIGRDGILPAAALLMGRRHWGADRFWRWPTLCWFSASDRALQLIAWGGASLAVLLILGVAPIPVLILLWVFYLSLFTVGRLFLCYQWDILLLEAGFLAIFLAPVELVPHWPRAAPALLSIWLLWWLLFRLMFWSGIVKFRSGDTSWRNLTALKYHYETQPLPTPLAWHAHQLPFWFHKTSALVVLAIEVIAPFLIFGPASCRSAAAVLFVALMILIQLTGNYAFFNLLAVALSLLLVDDRLLRPALRFCLPASASPVSPPSSFSCAAAVVACLVVLLLSLEQILRLARVEFSWPPWLGRFFDVIEPFHFLNSYGLFAIMTTWRQEIIVEGSNDGRLWQEYEFKWKPGDVCRAPRFAAPHQPRLDWQMWFAALGVGVSSSWFEVLCERLTEGSPVVLALLAKNPFPDTPPKYVRAIYYDYFFTTRAERRATGAWWKRERRLS